MSTRYRVESKHITGVEGQELYTVVATPVMNGRLVNRVNGGQGVEFPVTVVEFGKMNIGDQFTVNFAMVER